MNEVLIRKGLDERSRAMIINEAMRDPAIDELKRVAYGAAETVGRGVMVTGLWAAGEMADVAGFFLNKNMEGTIADYQGRETVATTVEAKYFRYRITGRIKMLSLT